MENGRNWIIKWLTGALWGFLILTLSIMANNVIANDKESRNRDHEIEIEVNENKRDIIEMKTDLKHIIRTQNEITGILRRRLPDD